MPFPLWLIEADVRLKSDVDVVNQALVEDSAIVSLWAFCCWNHLLGYSLSEMGRAGENVLNYGGWAGGKRGVLPSATPSTIHHPPPTPATWADVGKCVRDSNVFRQEASFRAERCIFNGDRKRDATLPPQSSSHRIRFDVCDMYEWHWAIQVHANMPVMWFDAPD